ncbi:hypothetical protein LXA43DRAFT_974023 [Ganoderma leucocontextum]|nr:hypothetical protein LXA43DRAFT_974023 [Ganoderma leucocontextum]
MDSKSIANGNGAALSAFAAGPQLGQIKNLVTFGDSYTDVNAHADGGTLPTTRSTALWIGRTTSGPSGLLTGKQTSGITLVDTVTWAVPNWVQTLYDNGARNFILQNECMVPLEAAPLYAVNSYLNHYWTAQRNTTEWHRGFFDSHSLFTDIYRNPRFNVTGVVHSCILKDNESTHDTSMCTIAKGTHQDSFLW